MREETEIKTWGTSVCLPLNSFIQKACGLSKGTPVSIEIQEDGFFVRPSPSKKVKKIGKLEIQVITEELLEGLSEEDFRYEFEEDFERAALEDWSKYE